MYTKRNAKIFLLSSLLTLPVFLSLYGIILAFMPILLLGFPLFSLFHVFFNLGGIVFSMLFLCRIQPVLACAALFIANTYFFLLLLPSKIEDTNVNNIAVTNVTSFILFLGAVAYDRIYMKRHFKKILTADNDKVLEMICENSASDTAFYLNRYERNDPALYNGLIARFEEIKIEYPFDDMNFVPINKKTREDISLIVLVCILPLVLGVYSIRWVEGAFDIELREHGRPHPFVMWASDYYPHDVYLDKQIKKLHIKEMSYEWEGNTGIFLKDEVWDNLQVDDGNSPCRYYDSLTNECLYSLYRISRHINKNVDFDRLFKGKKRGDRFKYAVKVVYSLDDGPESTQIFEQCVYVRRGKYEATWVKTLKGFEGPAFSIR